MKLVLRADQHWRLVGSGGQRFGLAGRPRGLISGGSGIDSEIPNIKIHLFWAQHLDEGILARSEWLHGRRLRPSPTDRLSLGGDPVPFLLRLAGDVGPQVDDDACVFLPLDFGYPIAVGVEVS